MMGGIMPMITVVCGCGRAGDFEAGSISPDDPVLHLEPWKRHGLCPTCVARAAERGVVIRR
jgi:hypothetical protein